MSGSRVQADPIVDSDDSLGDGSGVLSLAKTLGVFGLLWGVIVAVSWLVLGSPTGGRPGLPELLVAVVGGGLYGALGGALTALIYNAAAGLAGGIEFEVS